MNPRLATLLAAAVVGLILGLGVTLSLVQQTTYRSSANLVLAPASGTAPGDLPTLLDSIERSGTVGTYVELLGSNDVQRRAGSPPVEIAVRAVPNSRVITVTATGDRRVVRRALNSVLEAARTSQNELGDLWDLKVLESATPAQPAGLGPGPILAATVMLALLAGLGVFAALRTSFGTGLVARLDAQRAQPPSGEDTRWGESAGAPARGGGARRERVTGRAGDAPARGSASAATAQRPAAGSEEAGGRDLGDVQWTEGRRGNWHRSGD